MLLIAAGAHAQQEAPRLVHLDLEDLMNIEVTSVSKRPERLSDAAASIYVITGDDIRRSGASTLPEALRLAPNLQVAQVSAAGYAITARGFNNTAANKLLVLIDGRSVYTPLFSGVFWDAQDVLLEDVERIEVISGPGGTLWGVNAVNGVINIITRSAASTQGGLAAASGGNRGNDAALRYGGALTNGGYRAYAKYTTRNHTETASGLAKTDAWHKTFGGVRADWGRARDQLTLLANAYKSSEGQPLPGAISITGVNLPLDTIPISGVNLLANWKRVLGNDSSLTVQAYYDRTQRTVPPTFAERLDLADLQFQHSLRWGGRHAVAWGAEYRRSKDRLVNSTYFAFLPAKVEQQWANVFAQDEIALPKSLRLTLGARLEHNDYTGTELLPNARLAWKLAPTQLLWTAASRTVRAPSRLDRDAFVPGQPPFLLTGGPNVRSEVATVLEIGYRGQPRRSASVSFTAFHADYDLLRTQEIAPSRTSLFFGNGMEGTVRGVETWLTQQASSRWRLSAGFTAMQGKFRLKEGSNDASAVAGQMGRDPARSWRLRSSLDLPHHGEFDLTARRVAALSSPYVPSYSAVDLRYGWTPSPQWALSLAAQNVVGNGHAEFTNLSTRSELRRGVLLRAVTHF
jgi:iron complex outermembrane receptor protein